MNAPITRDTLGEIVSADAFRRSVDKRRFMTSRFVRRGASYWNALNAARKLFPLERVAS